MSTKQDVHHSEVNVGTCEINTIIVASRNFYTIEIFLKTSTNYMQLQMASCFQSIITEFLGIQEMKNLF